MIRFRAVKERLRSEELGEYDSYGVAAVRAAPGGEEVVAVVSDLFRDREAAVGLARRCTRGRLSPVHLADAALDAIS